MTGAAELHCGSCGAPLATRDRFCERCGAPAPVHEAPPARFPDEADRVELDLGTAAAVSDRGLVHRRNEDAFHVEVLGTATGAAVVCDGISLASAGDAAARTAAAAAGAVLDFAIRDPARIAGDEMGAAMAEAIQAAARAVEEVEWTTRTGRVVPSCTLVAAIWHGNEIAVGWAGDSRAYWIAGEGSGQLTVDDSFAAEAVAEGVLTPEEAARSPFMHSITHWVGPDAPGRPPRVVTFHPDGPGRLLLCTDGLWNYADTPEALRELIDALPSESPPADIARALTDAAVERGGRDNITVAVVDIS
jgi:serine/threonine protein phosphatase PrpC